MRDADTISCETDFKGGAIPLKKAASGFGVLHAFGPVLGNDAGGVQLGGPSGAPLTIDQLLAQGWEIAGYASGYDNRTSLILFRHPGVNALVQCGVLYDVTRVPRTTVNCYELR
jgi:hypothetical protein